MSKKKVVFRAKLAEQAERYEEMKDFMKEVVKKNKPILNQEERNLLSVAYKNVVGARRASWRVLDSIAKRESSDVGTGDAKQQRKAKYVTDYKAKVEAELSSICDDVLDLLDDYLLKGHEDWDKGRAEEQVFYRKMKGDYYRYKAEYLSKGNPALNKAREAYKAALEASEMLRATNPIRLGLALNFSVFHYEIRKDQKQACKLAKNAFDEAVGELEDLTEEQYKDATLIMQLLRDNLTLWNSEAEGDSDEISTMADEDMTNVRME